MNDLPSGWSFVPLMDNVDLHDSRRIPLNQTQRAVRKGPYPYYGANGQVDSINEYIFDGDFILVAEDGGYFDDPTRTVAYEASGKFWVNNHAHILSIKNGIPRRYLTYALNQIDWMSYVGGSTRLKLTQEGMRRIRIPLAPPTQRERIVAKLDGLLARSKGARDELARIPRLVERYKKAILSAAFQGELTHDDAGAWQSVALGEAIDAIDAGKNVRCEERPPTPHERGIVKVSSVSCFGAWQE
jgi:type I restriction enzyme S subunit